MWAAPNSLLAFGCGSRRLRALGSDLVDVLLHRRPVQYLAWIHCIRKLWSAEFPKYRATNSGTARSRELNRRSFRCQCWSSLLKSTSFAEL